MGPYCELVKTAAYVAMGGKGQFDTIANWIRPAAEPGHSVGQLDRVSFLWRMAAPIAKRIGLLLRYRWHAVGPLLSE